jgi:hypothetical protein
LLSVGLERSSGGRGGGLCRGRNSTSIGGGGKPWFIIYTTSHRRVTEIYFALKFID